LGGKPSAGASFCGDPTMKTWVGRRFGKDIYMDFPESWETNATRKNEPVWREDLQTYVSSLTYDFTTRIGRLIMLPDCCTDMRGVIVLFERIDPRVACVETFAGEQPDTIYLRRGNTWQPRAPI
jgi:hypothetical protein